MPRFSADSISKLSTCHPDLQALFYEVIKYIDCTIIEGHRGEDAQNAAFEKGNSLLKYPNGKHNSTPSSAVDVIPSTVGQSLDWNDTQRLCYFAGFVKATAISLQLAGKISRGIRWGGDWNQNNEMKDETFRDLVHFEITP